MNHKEFMTAVTGYYGNFKNDITKKLVAEFVSEIPESDLDRVLKNLMKTVEPEESISVAKIQKVLNPKVDIEAEALRWWEETNRRGNGLEDCIISDIRVQTCIDDFGGWGEFKKRDIKNEDGGDKDSYNQHKFIKNFKLYTESPPDRELRVMRGDSNNPPEKRLISTIMIGDQTKCLQVLENHKQMLGFQKKEGISHIQDVMSGVVANLKSDTGKTIKKLQGGEAI